MRIAPCLALAVFLSGCGGATPAVVVPDSGCATAVLDLRFERGLPVTTARFGSAEAELLVDLGGASAVTLSPESLERIPHEKTDRTRVFHNARGDHLESRELRVREIALSTLILKDVVGQEQVHAEGFAPPVEAGTIGLALLREFRLLVDYGGGELTMTDRRCPATDPPDPDTWTTARITSEDDGVVIDAVIDGQERRMVLDTGATYSALQRDAVPPDRVAEAGGQEVHAPARVEIGGTAVDDLDFAVVDWPGPGVDGVLGCNFFASRVVRIDFEARTVSFRPSTSRTPPMCPSPLIE
jgi:hypothetical protein